MTQNILEEIFEEKKCRVAGRLKGVDIDALIADAHETRVRAEDHRLRKALSGNGIGIIAEFKRASPSEGFINEFADPREITAAYERGGADAVSVLTSEYKFHGSMDDLRAARDTVALPILQKDFIFCQFQIYEAAAAGADAILLIAAMLDGETLYDLHRLAEEQLSLDALVEVHSEEEMERAKQLGARLIGINNRNLKTSVVSLDVSRNLIHAVPRDAVIVAESGLKSREEIQELNTSGFNGFLIGKTLMTATDPENALKELTK